MRDCDNWREIRGMRYLQCTQQRRKALRGKPQRFPVNAHLNKGPNQKTEKHEDDIIVKLCEFDESAKSITRQLKSNFLNEMDLLKLRNR